MANKITTLYENESKTNALFPRTKRLAISDENNNPLTEVGFYTSDTVMSGVEGLITGGVATDLLWTNEAPTSSFAAQTISLDLTDYGIIIIVFKAASTWAQLANAVITEKSNNNHRMEMLVNSDMRVRDFTVSNTGIAFGKNQNFRTSTLAYSDDNSCLLPYKIYGIKSANTINTHISKYVKSVVVEQLLSSKAGNSDLSDTIPIPSDISLDNVVGACYLGYVPSASWDTRFIMKYLNNSNYSYTYRTQGSTSQNYTVRFIIFYYGD